MVVTQKAQLHGEDAEGVGVITKENQTKLDRRHQTEEFERRAIEVRKVIEGQDLVDGAVNSTLGKSINKDTL